METPSLSETTKAIGNFESLNTPFHVIALAAILTLVLIPEYQIASTPWNFILITVIIVILLSIIFSLLRHPIERKKYRIQIKFARSVGIASAILCFLIAGDEAFKFPDLFFKVYIPSIAQIVIFGFYIFIMGRTENSNEKLNQEKNEDKKEKTIRRPSLLQLALITTALLVGIARNAHSGAKYYEEINSKEQSFYAPNNESLRQEAMKINGLEEIQDNALDRMAVLAEKLATKMDTFKLKQEDVIIEKTIDSLRNSYSFVLTSEILVDRFDRVDKILFRYWMFCMFIWIYFIAKTLTPNLTFGGDID